MNRPGRCFLIMLLLTCCPAAVRAQGALGQRIDELSQQIASKMTAKQKTTVAVVEFTDLQGNVTDFGRFLAEELITRLYETEKFRVIERQQLNKVIAEQKLSLTGVVDPASAKQLGRILGVEAIVSGTITNLSQSVKVNARLISTETGEIFAVASTEIFKDESVVGLLNSKGSPPALGTKPAPPSAGADIRAAKKVVENDFTFELNSCQRSLNSVTCSLIITNDASEEKRVSLTAADSRIFDETGNEYHAKRSTIGGSVSDNSYGFGVAANNLLPQVPIKASLKFENVSPEARRVTLMILTYAGQGLRGQSFKVTFRDVEIK